jgi:hypothetical protein
VKNAYGIKLPDEVPMTFSRDALLYNWDCYIWLKQQLDENDKTKLYCIRDFLNHPQYHHFIVSFIRSNFAPNENCELYEWFSSIFFNETSIGMTTSNATQHPDEKQRSKYNVRFDKRLEIIKNEVKICNEKYNGCDRIKWKNREKASKYFHNCNTTFHRCCGVLQFARERQLWVEFNKTDEVKRFFGRIKTHESSSVNTRTNRVIKFLTAKMSKIGDDDCPSANDSKTIIQTMHYYNHLYRTNTGQMSCKTSRDKWKAFCDLHKHKYHLTYTKYNARNKKEKQCPLDEENELLLDDASFSECVDEYYATHTH